MATSVVRSEVSESPHPYCVRGSSSGGGAEGGSGCGGGGGEGSSGGGCGGGEGSSGGGGGVVEGESAPHSTGAGPASDGRRRTSIPVESAHGMAIANSPSVLVSVTVYASSETVQPARASTLPTKGEASAVATRSIVRELLAPSPPPLPQSARTLARTVVPAAGDGT